MTKEENNNSQTEIPIFKTKDEAIDEYTKKFGGFPYFLFMGASMALAYQQDLVEVGKKITINQEEKKNTDY